MMLPRQNKDLLCSKAVAARPMHDELVMLKQDCECEQILENRSRQSSLAALTTPGSRAQDFVRRGSVQEISTAHWPADEA